MRARVVRHEQFHYAPSLRRRLLAVMAPARTTTEELTRLNAEIGDAFARTAAATIARLSRSQRPSLIGLAGQTVCHLPTHGQGGTVTLQLGEASRVAFRTGVPTVSQFRQSDVAAGGQGAPLVPWTDWVLLGSPTVARAVQNIGGIGNVTWIPPGAGQQDVVAFDTGPGNMLIDGLVRHITQGRVHMDRNGSKAARGRILTGILARWMGHPFLRLAPPRTTGREQFGEPFLNAELPHLRRASREPEDWIATATAFTAATIGQAVRELGRGLGRSKRRASTEVVLCGGGARNRTLVSMIASELPGCQVRIIDAFGIPAEAKESLSFALLAVARVDGVAGNLPQVTGASRPVILGAITV